MTLAETSPKRPKPTQTLVVQVEPKANLTIQELRATSHHELVSSDLQSVSGRSICQFRLDTFASTRRSWKGKEILSIPLMFRNRQIEDVHIQQHLPPGKGWFIDTPITIPMCFHVCFQSPPSLCVELVCSPQFLLSSSISSDELSGSSNCANCLPNRSKTRAASVSPRVDDRRRVDSRFAPRSPVELHR